MRLEAHGLGFRYGKGDWVFRHLDFAIAEGERLGLIGPSGCGKSTLAKLLAGYLQAHEGQITLDGKPLPAHGFCPVQLVWQHPEQAINPRWKMARVVSEAHDPDPQLCRALGIEDAWMERWPNELSGGELQRFSLARTLDPRVRFLLADEISTMLDVVTQAQIWQVVDDFVAKARCGLLVVTHNRALAERVCDHIVTMQQIAEMPPAAATQT